MSGPADTTDARHDGGFLAPRPGSRPVDHCFRCGKETPAGVGLCEDHNRGHVSGPSATQMHATIFGGIALGVLAFFILASIAISTSGPYTSEITAVSAGLEGRVTLSFTVTNEGADDGAADCRVTRDGVPRPDDFAFRTTPLAGGETLVLQRELMAPPQGSVGYDTERLTVVCS